MQTRTYSCEAAHSVDPEKVDPRIAAAQWADDRKRNLVMAALPRQRYLRALEPGCGSGKLTRALALRCDQVVAWDTSRAAVERCGVRAADQPRVQIRVARAPQYWPAGSADLVVISEVGYHLSDDDLHRMITLAIGSLSAGGTLLAVHGRHYMPEHLLGGDDVHARLFGRPGLPRVGGYADDDLRLDVFEREPQA
jgi:SAM-dependent methyltransferase